MSSISRVQKIYQMHKPIFPAQMASVAHHEEITIISQMPVKSRRCWGPLSLPYFVHFLTYYSPMKIALYSDESPNIK